MAERVSPWRSKPPQEVVELLQTVGTVQLFLVHRPGPTSFLVREEGSEVKRKVQIGSRISCSCSPVGANGTCKEVCLHTLFVMIKVLRVPVSNPLLWQLSFSDRELEEVLRCSMQPERPPQEAMRTRPAAEKTPAGQVKRKEVDEEDPCPICYEEMVGQDMDNLVWCRFSCGRNVHGKCMGVWMEHQVQSLGKELTCPLCRSDWGDFKWRPPPPKRKTREERKDVHYGTHCSACKKAPLIGKRFRCLICSDFDLCDGCFDGGHHPQHPFAVKDTPKSFGAPAERPTMMPTALPIARLALPPGGAGSTAQTSPRHSSTHQAQRTHSHGLPDGVGSGPAGAESDGHGEGEGRAEGAAGGGGGAVMVVAASGVGPGRDALVVGLLAQQQQQQQQQQQHTTPPRPGAGAGPAGSRHPVRGTTVARAGGAPRAPPDEHPSPPSLEARLAQRRPLLAVEGLTVGPAGAALGPGAQHAPLDIGDLLVRRVAPGQPSRPVVVRRTRSTVHDRPAPEAGGGGPSGELNLGLAGVQLSMGGQQGEAAGPGPGSLAAASSRQHAPSNMPPRHPPRPNGQVPGRPGLSARPHHISAVAWAHPTTSSGHAAAAAPPQPPDLVLQGRVVPHGEPASPGPVGRLPPPPAAHGRAGPGEPGATGAHSTTGQQPSGPQGVRYRGPPPRYVPPVDQQHQQQTGLRRTHSAGPQGPMGLGLAVTARSMAPHPLTPPTPLPAVAPTLAPAVPAPSPLGNMYISGAYGPEPYGNETYGGTIQYDDNLLVAFSHHIPGPGASFHEGAGSGTGPIGPGEWVIAQGQAGAGAEWSSGRGGVEDDEQPEEFPRGPVSPHLHLFSSRPNTVPSELISDMYGENRGFSRSLSHSLSHSQSFTLSPSGRRVGGSRGPSRAAGDASLGCSPTHHASPGASRSFHLSAAQWPPEVETPTRGCRDSVLLASVKMDAMDDWMDSMRQRQVPPSRDGGASSVGQSYSGAPPLAMSYSGGVLAMSYSGGAPAASPRGPHAEGYGGLGGVVARSTRTSATGMRSSALGMLTVEEEASPSEAATAAARGLDLTGSLEDTLAAFMVEQRTAANTTVPRPDRAEGSFTTYANPVFNRPYTLDMSLQ